MFISLRDVSLTLGDRQLFHFLNCDLFGGQMTAIMGPSGSGKSTLLAVISGARDPDSGTVVMVGDRPESVRVDWIVQSTPLLRRRNVLDNVRLGGLSRGLSVEHSTENSFETMRALGIDGLRAVPVFRLSGGERQRVAVARCMMADSDIILADEPTASLDAASRESVVIALTQAAAAGALVVVATHDKAVAQACHRVIDL